MSWNEFRNKLVNEITSTLWAQWSALGIRSTGRFKPLAVDLEALLLGTWSFGRTDPRLFDEALNWCCQYGNFVNVKRLQKLLSELDAPATTNIALAWKEVVKEHGSVRWNLDLARQQLSESLQNLFVDEALESDSDVPSQEPLFEEWGFARGKFEPRRHATAPDLSDLQLVQLFARKFMGGGGRSEIFAILLLGIEATTGELADMAMYSRRYVQTVLEDLKAAGLLDWDPGRGRTTRASLKKRTRQKFQSLIACNAAVGGANSRLEVRDWAGFFLGFHALWQAAVRITQSRFDGFKAQALLRDALEEALEYHGRTSLETIYRPRLAADSLDKLLREAEYYLDDLVDEDSYMSTHRAEKLSK